MTRREMIRAMAALPLLCTPARAQDTDEISEIARQAFIYAAAPIQSYGTWFIQAVDTTAPEYVGGFNTFRHYADVFTPDNKDIVTPNNDTPYSWAWLDLRAEPVVVSVPEVDEGRYYVLQLIDIFTHNFAYIGTRATGNEAGDFLIAGPGWQGEAPSGVHAVLRSEGDIVGILGRTQLRGAADLPRVREIQKGYRLTPLSGFSGSAPPTPVSAPDFPPYDAARAAGRDFISYLNFLLQFAQPPVAQEAALLKRSSRIGIGPGRVWPVKDFDAATLAAIDKGIAQAKADIAAAVKATTSSNGLFGTRDELGGDYMRRTVGARIGIYGNSLSEAWYGGLSDDGAATVALRFDADALPPARYFWSMTLYTLPERLLYANELKRYSIGSETDGLVMGEDGSLTLYIGNADPGVERRPNWLPAPAGRWNAVMRLYGPDERAIDGRWSLPAPEPVE